MRVGRCSNSGTNALLALQGQYAGRSAVSVSDLLRNPQNTTFAGLSLASRLICAKLRLHNNIMVEGFSMSGTGKNMLLLLGGIYHDFEGFREFV
ncbi:MAG: hypothetical protein RBT75_16460, partial [Anaerolineae bacterium]|nr:hypothetical protein [Anaerolineae bacterium]